ncbi:helix-turn-helix transcriptional regulator [Peribacillus asahii]|uniref:helix-turn-helix transcriptional regulator n=1 Tax=Peribacillus asahii TaxID=228899 RepID=UPI00207B0216|nr:helix-turn-helix transcriptional regulator [Peribacillus asahii]USK71731.1 helix-turn-helix domain-containing protein [Peribacillus asahii]
MYQLRKKPNSRKNSKVKTSSQELGNIKGVKRERLILERKKRKLTQGQLGELLGVKAALISHLENGRVKPSLEITLGLQEIFKLPFEILFPDL